MWCSLPDLLIGLCIYYNGGYSAGSDSNTTTASNLFSELPTSNLSSVILQTIRRGATNWRAARHSIKRIGGRALSGKYAFALWTEYQHKMRLFHPEPIMDGQGARWCTWGEFEYNYQVEWEWRTRTECLVVNKLWCTEWMNEGHTELYYFSLLSVVGPRKINTWMDGCLLDDDSKIHVKWGKFTSFSYDKFYLFRFLYFFSSMFGSHASSKMSNSSHFSRSQ